MDPDDVLGEVDNLRKERKECGDEYSPFPYKIWVDTASGTWGEIGELRILELENEEEFNLFSEIMSDSHRSEYAEKNGEPAEVD